MIMMAVPFWQHVQDIKLYRCWQATLPSGVRSDLDTLLVPVTL